MRQQQDEEYKSQLLDGEYMDPTAKPSSLLPYTANTYTFIEEDQKSNFLLLEVTCLIGMLETDIPDKYLNTLTLDLAEWCVQKRSQ